VPLSYQPTGPAAEPEVGKVGAQWRVLFLKMVRRPGSTCATHVHAIHGCSRKKIGGWGSWRTATLPGSDLGADDEQNRQ
jgi:hypothetical protein